MSCGLGPIWWYSNISVTISSRKLEKPEVKEIVDSLGAVKSCSVSFEIKGKISSQITYHPSSSLLCDPRQHLWVTKPWWQMPGSTLRQRAMVYWKVSGIWRDNYVLCHTKQTSCQFGVVINFYSSIWVLWISICVFGKIHLSAAHIHVSKFLSGLLISL